MKRLVFTWDYLADPLWAVVDRPGQITEGMRSLDQLPVSAETRQRVREWARHQDQFNYDLMDASDTGYSVDPAEKWPGREAALAEEGEWALRTLREELRDGWLIGRLIWHDNCRFVQWEDGGPEERLPVAWKWGEPVSADLPDDINKADWN